MDTITHTLFGLALYGAVDKREFTKNEKRALLFTTIVGSQVPDMDVVSQLWDTEGQYQMWHRGLTHSIFMVPIFALIIYWFTRWKWKVKDSLYLWIGLLAVFIHSTIDLFNAWGTGYLEPFSSIRITFGTIPIIDFVFWSILLAAFVVSRRIRSYPTHIVYRTAWAFIALHILLQTAQGFVIYQQYSEEYDEKALSASFLPGHFSLVGKIDNNVSIYDTSLFSEDEIVYELQSVENADLDFLFANNPEAETLYQWAPFVVIVDDGDRLGVYDPRFYRNGQSFLFEYMKREEMFEESSH